MSGRLHKSILNAEVNLAFYFIALFVSFFSRKIFLDNLGADFIGLTGTLGNILGYLNLAELGIGSCISIFLYKPLQTGDKKSINEIISIFGYLYRQIGLIILSLGIIISIFFPLIFKNEDLGYGIIYFAFYSFLGSSLIGYFINYKQILLSADQKNYIVSGYFQTAGIVKSIIQILLAYYYCNYYFWVAIEFIFGLICCIILNWRIRKEYPWLKSNKSKGNGLLKKYPKILTNTRQIFIHSIKDFLLNKSDELFVYIFVSLQMVAYYGNYIIITTKITQLFTRAQDGIGASVGNLISENNKNNIIRIFWEIMSAKYMTAGFLCFSTYHFTEPFINVWLGKEYILSHNILILLVIYIYISNTRGAVDMYNHAYGLYADTWSAWTELIINICITIIFGIKYGIIGLLLGKIISTGIIVIFWKPYYLFSKGLHLPYSYYWKGVIRYHFALAISFIAASYLITKIPIVASIGYFSWAIYCTVSIVIFLSLLLTTFYFTTFGTIDLIKRIKK